LGNNVGLIHKSILRAVKAASFAGLALGLLGCAATDVTVPDIVDNAQATTETTAENPVEFSTKGKPTKTIETPWGPREIYDPASDNFFAAAVAKIFNTGTFTYGDVSRYDGYSDQTAWFNFYSQKEGLDSNNREKYSHPNSNVEYVKRARFTSYYDLLRLGCKKIEEVPNQSIGIQYFRDTCPDSQLGQPNLTKCESTMLVKSAMKQPIQNVVVPASELDRFRWKTKYFEKNQSEDREFSYPKLSSALVLHGKLYDIQNLHLIGQISGFTLKENLQLLSSFSCVEWMEKKNLNLLEDK